ncbi:peptidase inhibitor family I36 protein [Streptomyces sp. CWNU-52B]|uniref:peptidase inhibitor family I36 protein n=1 Tax=unclassified Streptomyces TaxID=2593676 RepID=UPI0039C4D47F
MRTRALTGISAAVLAVGGLLVSGTPAAAAESDCGAGRICLFKDYDYNGRILEITAIGTRVDNLKGWDFNDATSSVVNNSSVTVRLYQDLNQGGKYVVVAPGQRIANLSSVPIYNADGSYFGVNTFNDRTSSTW